MFQQVPTLFFQMDNVTNEPKEPWANRRRSHVHISMGNLLVPPKPENGPVLTWADQIS